MTWLTVTTVMVLGLAISGTIDLFSGTAAGAGGGRGPEPAVQAPRRASTRWRCR